MNRYNDVYLDRVRELSSSIFEICLYDLNIIPRRCWIWKLPYDK